MKKPITAIATLVTLFLFVGCATVPTMSLSHLPQSEGYSYPEKGSINVSLFEDHRPLGEREGSKPLSTFKNVWSQNTDPPVNQFLKQVIIKEFKESKLFNPTESNDADYFLSGEIKSLKVEQKLGTVGLINLPVSFAGGFLWGYNKDITLLIPAIILGLANNDPITVTVSYEATLTKGKNVVWKETILDVYHERMWTAFKNTKKRSKICSVYLDRSITTSARKMLKDISATNL